MLSWLAENGGTIGVLVLLLLVVGGIIAGILRDRRKGKSSCGSNCSSCPMGGSCHPKNSDFTGQQGAPASCWFFCCSAADSPPDREPPTVRECSLRSICPRSGGGAIAKRHEIC